MIGYPFDSQVTFDSNGTPVYDRAISSVPLKQLIKKLFSTGILPNPSTNLQVQAGTGMNVVVNPGFAVIEGGLKYEESKRTIAVQASDTTYDRIDTVVMRWNDNPNARICDLYVVQGVPSSSPIRPELNRESSVYELGLADLFIPANSSAISNARITDTRYETERCGVVSSVSEFDSDTIYKQIQTDLAEFKAEEQVGFLAWFEQIKNQLSEDAAGNLQLQIDGLKVADTQNNTVSFESGDSIEAEKFEEVELLESGETHRSIISKVSTMFKNVRRLIKLMGTEDISAIGNGTVTGGLSELNSKSDALSTTLKNRVRSSAAIDNSTSLNVAIGQGEFGGIILINRGYYTADYAAYEFHIINDKIAVNKIIGTDFITSYSYDRSTGMINFVVTQTYLRLRLFWS